MSWTRALAELPLRAVVTPVGDGTSPRAATVEATADTAGRGRTVTDALLHVDGVSVSYGGGAIEALNAVSMRVAAGEIVVLLGANGAGKTTTLRAITGLLRMHGGRIDAGRVLFDGDRIDGASSWSTVRRGIGLVMEGRRVFAQLSVEDNLRAGGTITRDKARYTANYAQVMALFPQLAERRTVSAGLLSGGEQQMLAMGRALMQSPRLLLLDEPSLGLAPLIVDRIREIIVEINALGTSVVLIEQNAAMALSVADYGYILERRRIAREGTGADLLADESIRELYLGLGSQGRRTYRDRRATSRGASSEHRATSRGASSEHRATSRGASSD